MNKREQRAARATKANELIKTIATTGRRFFAYPKQHGFSKFEIDQRSRIWFIDGYTGKRIYLHYKYWGGPEKGFSEGGTLKQLINALKKYIATNQYVYASTFGPWPKSMCEGDLWGYGNDMQKVRDHAQELEISDLGRPAKEKNRQ